jgi:hypothetical protein
MFYQKKKKEIIWQIKIVLLIKIKFFWKLFWYKSYALISKIKLWLFIETEKNYWDEYWTKKTYSMFKRKFSPITQIFVSESFSPNRSTQKYNLSECNTTKRLSSQCKTFLNVINSHHEIDRKYILILWHKIIFLAQTLYGFVEWFQNFT